MAMAKTMRFRLAAVLALALGVPAAQALPIKWVPVRLPALNCVFNNSCTISIVSVQSAPIPLAPRGLLRSQTFKGAALGAGAPPGAGQWGYMYQVDMTNAVPTAPCVISLQISQLVRVTPLPYAGPLLVDVFDISLGGGPGTIPLSMVDQNQNGWLLFTFANPVCPGRSSFYFGLASPAGPVPAGAGNVQVQMTPLGASHPVGPVVLVP
jgi:hypothetical protein